MAPSRLLGRRCLRNLAGIFHSFRTRLLADFAPWIVSRSELHPDTRHRRLPQMSNIQFQSKYVTGHRLPAKYAETNPVGRTSLRAVGRQAERTGLWDATSANQNQPQPHAFHFAW